MGTRTRALRFLSACLLVALLQSVALAAGRAKPPAEVRVLPPAPRPQRGPPDQPVPPPVDAFRWVYPLRWTWVHWWEANRDAYLQALRQGKEQEPTAEALAQWRKEAFDALRGALESNVPEVRACAALALGQMGEERAFEPLKDLARGDRELRVRQAALLAIGLLDMPEGEAFILGLELKKRHDEWEAALTALGLMGRSSPDVIAGFQGLLQGNDPSASAISAWALSRRTDPANAKFLQGVLGTAVRPWLASAAILSLGYQGKPDSAPLLADILLATPRAKALPAMKDLETRDTGLTYLWNSRNATQEAYQSRYEHWVKDFHQWFRDHDYHGAGSPYRHFWVGDKMSNQWYPLAPVVPQRVDLLKMVAVPRFLVIGLERIDLANLRASAAIALGGLDCPVSRDALRKALEIKEDGYDLPYKEMAILSLGKLGDAAAAPALAAMVRPPSRPGVVASKDRLQSPLRGFAAVALGLYARPLQTPQGVVDRPDYDKMCLLLGERLADAGEEPELRSACALALGLSARTENLKYLQAASRTVGGDEPLVGYVLLARGMLGDRTIVPAAKGYLDPARDRVDVPGILGRRAAVVGLGLMGSEEAIPVLTASWELNYSVNRETARALSLGGGLNGTDRLAALLKDSNDPRTKALAARCLGELHIRWRPPRLSWLTAGSNYMMKTNSLTLYQAVANEFLYTCLLPAFGEQWGHAQDEWEEQNEEMLDPMRQGWIYGSEHIRDVRLLNVFPLDR